MRRLIILVTALALWGCESEGAPASAQSAKKGMKVAPAATVQGHVLAQAPFEVVRDYGGEFATDAMANLSAEVTGVVKEINVRLGDSVKKGDVLAVIDPVTYQQRVKELEASVAVARASAEEARAQKSNLEADLMRREPLLARNLVTEREIEDLKSQIAVAQQRIDVAEATVQQNQARLSTGRVSLQDTRVRAPFDGIVAERFVDIGNHVSAGTQLFRVVDDSDIYLQLRVAETDSGMIQTEMPVVVRVDALGGESVPGKVGRIAPAVDPQTRTMRIDVLPADDAPDSWDRIKPGMYARAQIVLSSKDSALIAPSQAVLKDRDGTRYVWTVKDDKAHRITVTPGLKNRSATEILGGIEAGETIVLRGHEKLVEGGKVQLVQELEEDDS